MGAHETVERDGQLDSEGVRSGGDDTTGGVADLEGTHASDPGQDLGVEQDEQARDAAVWSDPVVVQQQLDVGLPVVIGQG